jgi:molybdate transport system ATP-binding protein
MEKLPVVQAKDLTVVINSRKILNNLSFTVNRGEQWVVTGDSGVGKTTLLQVLSGRLYYRGELLKNLRTGSGPSVVFVEQQHHFRNLSNTTQFYYQQRFNSSDSEDAITVREDLQNHLYGSETADSRLNEIIEIFHLQPLLDERLIQLSNGENKRLQIAKALLDQPALLLLDNPFIGLDTAARILLEQVLTRIAQQDIQIMMVCSTRYIPPFITHVLTLESDGAYSISESSSYIRKKEVVRHSITKDKELFASLVTSSMQEDFIFAVRMTHVNITYHNKKILDGINWEIKKGERWSLSGPNGAGKSTLLSLITADNPQAYANNIFLFDRKRGTGETIWEIKKKIGYISPELHLHFEQSNNCFEVIASGLFDTIGLFRQMSDDQVDLVNKWMKLLQLHTLKNKMLFQLSNSEQRMVLLARALVKNPPVLILDEPCQGLDEQQVENFKSLINEICIHGNKTLIYVSHYPDEIPACVDRFIRLENGRVKV